MKRFWVIGLVSLIAFGVVGFSIAHSQWGTPMMGMMQRGWNNNSNMPMMEYGYGNWNIPMMGMMGRGWNMPMMGFNYCMGNWEGNGQYGTMGNWTGNGQYGTMPPSSTTALTEEQAKAIVQNYIQYTGNPNLKVGKVKENDTNFEVDIVTKDNSPVDKIQIDTPFNVPFQHYIKYTGNPNLKVGKVTETGTNFEVEIVTKDNSLVDKIQVDQHTGWTRSIY